MDNIPEQFFCRFLFYSKLILNLRHCIRSHQCATSLLNKGIVISSVKYTLWVRLGNNPDIQNNLFFFLLWD